MVAERTKRFLPVGEAADQTSQSSQSGIRLA